MKQLLGKNYIIKLIWIFILGALFGYFIETGYYFLKHGVFLNKQGLLYGHIKPIYGFGGVLITIFLSIFVNKSNWKIFIYGCIFGGVFEYICSLVLEYIFHTSMWLYHNRYLSINGRVNLLYIPAWGVAALFWLRVVMPWFNKAFDTINYKVLRVVTVILTILIVFDFLISIVAVDRMNQRDKGIKASNAVERFLDKHYPDEFITKRIPYLKIVN